jgi:hypothetical protein
LEDRGKRQKAKSQVEVKVKAEERPVLLCCGCAVLQCCEMHEIQGIKLTFFLIFSRQASIGHVVSSQPEKIVDACGMGWKADLVDFHREPFFSKSIVLEYPFQSFPSIIINRLPVSSPTMSESLNSSLRSLASVLNEILGFFPSEGLR